MATSSRAKRTRLALWMATFEDDCVVCCNGGGMDGAKGSERPINAGLTNGLPTAGCSDLNTFSSVDGYVRRRLRSLLQWRRDGRGKGIGAAHQRWPNQWFAHRGLLSLAAEHEWTRTIVALRHH